MLQDIYLYDYLFSKLNCNLPTKNGKNKTFGRVTKSKDYSLLSARGKNLGQAFLKACAVGGLTHMRSMCVGVAETGARVALVALRRARKLISAFSF